MVKHTKRISKSQKKSQKRRKSSRKSTAKKSQKRRKSSKKAQKRKQNDSSSPLSRYKNVTFLGPNKAATEENFNAIKAEAKAKAADIKAKAEAEAEAKAADIKAKAEAKDILTAAYNKYIKKNCNSSTNSKPLFKVCVQKELKDLKKKEKLNTTGVKLDGVEYFLVNERVP
jgi:hypothetical protein